MTEDWVPEETDGYDWLVESRLQKSGGGVAITTGTDEDGETVYFACSFKHPVKSPESRSYEVFSAAYDIEKARTALDKYTSDEAIESNIIQ